MTLGRPFDGCPAVEGAALSCATEHRPDERDLTDEGHLGETA
ncbi:hypothetical protein ACIBO1_19255 [Micromonospora sp. NPDC049903]